MEITLTILRIINLILAFSVVSVSFLMLYELIRGSSELPSEYKTTSILLRFLFGTFIFSSFFLFIVYLLIFLNAFQDQEFKNVVLNFDVMFRSLGLLSAGIVMFLIQKGRL